MNVKILNGIKYLILTDNKNAKQNIKIEFPTIYYFVFNHEVYFKLMRPQMFSLYIYVVVLLVHEILLISLR